MAIYSSPFLTNKQIYVVQIRPETSVFARVLAFFTSVVCMASLGTYCSMNVSYSRRLSWRESMIRPVHSVISTDRVKP